MPRAKLKLYKVYFLTVSVIFVLVLQIVFHKSFELSYNYSNRNANWKNATTLAFEASLAPFKAHHVTKSLAELGKMDQVNKHILLLNEVPNSGSELLIWLLKSLQGLNNFKHVKLKGNRHSLSESQEEEFVFNAYDIIRKEAIPLSMNRNAYFVNFTKYDRQSPTFINMIRHPADYLLSRFHHLQQNPKLKNINTFAKIQDCILNKNPECSFRSGQKYDFTIAYFCGQHPRCMILNDDWSLRRAQQNVEKYYSTVGILEELNTTLTVLEHTTAYFFRGVRSIYHRQFLSHFQGDPRQNKKSPKSSEPFKKLVKLILPKEDEFYQWIKQRLLTKLRIANERL